MMNGNNNNMDNKLRQLENQSLPDLSKQDEHWQEMKKMLQPGVVPQEPKRGSNGKLWQWIVAACFIGAISFLIFSQGGDNTRHPKPTAVINNDTTGIKTKPEEIKVQVPEKVLINETSLEKKTERKAPKIVEVKFRIKKPGYKAPDIAQVLPADTMTIPQQTEPQATLAGFFNQLEKALQEFVIDTKKDTIIKGNDGTFLFIPANTFSGNQPVTISLKEFYSYKDIITNKLTTTSNSQQLISGGMIHITASVNGREVSMIPGQSIRWFIPDTTTELNEMKLFTGQVKKVDSRSNITDNTERDTLFSENGFTGINWIPQFQNFSTSGVFTEVKALDLRDYPYRITTGKKTKAFFYMKNDSELSKEELLTLLSARNKWYDKIIIRKHKEKDWCTYTLRRELIDCYTAIGDTINITPRLAKIYKLPVFDTIISIRQNTVRRQVSGNLRMELNNMNNLYSVEISSLGWVNCDRFYNDSRPKIQYFVNLKDTASNYYTLLVFDKIKSMMTGIISGDKVVFLNVPEGEIAKVISVGIKNGKPVSAMETVQLSRTTLTGLKFEETTPSQFKEQAASMDK